ncbi:MAG: molybdopterin molybdotransferase MoeA [Haloarculaceae archaeon]
MGHDHEDMIWRDAAVETVQRVRETALERQETETISLDRIGGRTLANSIVASEDVPAHDHATMDGYAFDATDDYPLSIRESEIFPETEPPSLGPGEAIEIATGAALPPEANAVLKREEATVSDGQLTGQSLEPGTYTYERGSNVQAGEQLFAAGERLAAKDAILLGDLGRDEVAVTERFRAGVLATGTEIHEDRQQDLDSPMLANLVRSWGHEATYEGTVPDDYDSVRDTIANLADEYDVVLTTGGTSVGHKDYVIRALEDLGEVHFHRVRIRPGKPIAVADLGDTIVFAIPGKPLGAYTISTLVMRPFFTGRTDLPSQKATLTHDVALGPEGFEYAVPVTLDGKEALPLGHVESPLQVYEETFDPSVLSSSTRATRADGFVLTRSGLTADETIEVVPYPVLE